MRVHRLTAAFLALLALFFSACGGSGGAVTPDETTDPVYQEAQDLKKQGRYGEALSAYLKVIDRRGENGAPESHLEAANLYLNSSHDPVEAYHHFGKYLELHPTGPASEIVRGQRDAAMREIAKLLHAPAGDTSLSLNSAGSSDVEQLKRRIEELEAENQTLRGASSVPVVRAPQVIALPDDNGATNPAAADTARPTPVSPAPAAAQSPFTRSLSTPPSTRVAPAPAPARQPPVIATESTPSAAERSAVAPTRPATSRGTVAATPATARRTHTVTSSEKSLWGIARRYYGSVTNARVQAIYEANRDVMRSPSDLRAGMVLRIP